MYKFPCPGQQINFEYDAYFLLTTAALIILSPHLLIYCLLVSYLTAL